MLSKEKLKDMEGKYIAKMQKVPYLPVAFDSGRGALLYDDQGKEYIDFLSSASSANLGHGNMAVADAVYEQMKKMSQYTLAYFNTEPPIRLAEKLCQIAPFENAKVVFSTTGSASVDAAIKVARAYTGRSKIISMFESYHGSTYGALSVSALSTNMRKKIGPLLPEIYHMHYPNKNFSLEDSKKEFQYAFRYYLPAEEVAAIIIEPLAGDAGLIIPPREWLEFLRELCDEYGILLISDEIQQGMCRTGKWFCMENYGVQADLYVLGKSLGGGLPLGALLGRKEILEVLDPPAHLFTLAAGGAVAAGALENIRQLEAIDANSLAREKGAYMKGKFEELKENYYLIGDIRQLGLSLGVDIVDEDGNKSPENCSKLCHEAISNGLLMIFLNQVSLRIQPPLVITYEEIDRAMEIIEEGLKKIVAGKVSDDVVNKIQGW